MALVGLPWRAAASDIDEQAYLLPDPLVAALNVAAAKVRASKADLDDEIIVGADTLVVSDGDVLGKPTDADAARLMLRRLRGGSHQVLTGVALRRADELEWGSVVSTRVVMRDYSEGDIAEYVTRAEPFDKAGGYAIQDEVFHPVERLEGCYLNVVGLPLCAVAAGLVALGVEVERAGAPPCAFCAAGAPLVRSGY